MHRDIRAILSHYAHNLRELSALYGNNHAIISGYKCSIHNILCEDYILQGKYIYINNRFYNNMEIIKNIYYNYSKKIYICKYAIKYNYYEFRIAYKYIFIFHDINHSYYRHYISNNYYIQFYFDNYDYGKYCINYIIYNINLQQYYCIRRNIDNGDEIHKLFIDSTKKIDSNYILKNYKITCS